MPPEAGAELGQVAVSLNAVPRRETRPSEQAAGALAQRLGADCGKGGDRRLEVRPAAIRVSAALSSARSRSSCSCARS